MKRKNTIRRIATLVLCIVIALTASNLQTASAATEKLPLKVTFNGKNGKKTVTIVKDLNKDHDGIKIKTLKSKWGKPSKEENYGTNTEYTWKKGKTSVTVNNGPGTDYVWGLSVQIKDKNASLFGVTVGMKKNKAVKKLEKGMGTKANVESPETAEILGYDEVITVPHPNGGPSTIMLGLNNGKVVSVTFGMS